jgi:hypothetical protein
LPDPIQLDPPAGLERLTTTEVAGAVDAARADETVAAALAGGNVEHVLVQAAKTGTPVGDSAAFVAFVFDTPVEPVASPYETLCDIAGQTAEWRGVAARISEREVISSPIWLTGATCIGLVLPR